MNYLLCMKKFFIAPVSYRLSRTHQLDDKVFSKRYLAYRNKASYYTNREDVKEYFFNKYKKCAYCGSTENLTLDHIRDIYTCAMAMIPIECVNCESNIQVLCNKCNAGKPLHMKYLNIRWCDDMEIPLVKKEE